jgi:uncharacterized protein (TIGR03086 family)
MGGMTIDTHTTPVAPAEAPSGADPRPTFECAVALATTVIDAVSPEQLAEPTPCADFDVQALLAHLVTVLRRVAAIGRGDDPFGRDVVVSVADIAQGCTQAWRAAVSDAADAWTDDAALARVVRLPWAEDTGAGTLVGYVSEVTVHTWDLATATGQRPDWDPGVLLRSLDWIRGVLPADGRAALVAEAKANMPPERRDVADPFADAVPVPEDAPLIDRLVAWTGRQP